MPEAVIQILPNRKNSINFGHLNFWTRGSKHIQAFLCIYRPRICFMGLHFTGLVNTGYRSVFTEKKCFIASVFGNTEFCNYRLVLQACNYRILYFLYHWILVESPSSTRRKSLGQDSRALTQQSWWFTRNKLEFSDSDQEMSGNQHHSNPSKEHTCQRLPIAIQNQLKPDPHPPNV